MDELKRQWSKLNTNIKTLVAVILILIIAGGVASLARGQSQNTLDYEPYCMSKIDEIEMREYTDYFGYLVHNGGYFETQAYRDSLEHVFGDYLGILDTNWWGIGIVRFQHQDILVFFDHFHGDCIFLIDMPENAEDWT